MPHFTVRSDHHAKSYDRRSLLGHCVIVCNIVTDLTGLYLHLAVIRFIKPEVHTYHQYAPADCRADIQLAENRICAGTDGLCSVAVHHVLERDIDIRVLRETFYIPVAVDCNCHLPDRTVSSNLDREFIIVTLHHRAHHRSCRKEAPQSRGHDRICVM